MSDLDTAHLNDVVSLLRQIPADGRLTALKNLALNNGGQWKLPPAKHMDGYRVAYVEIQVFGIMAQARDVTELPDQWLAKANAALARLQND